MTNKVNRDTPRPLCNGLFVVQYGEVGEPYALEMENGGEGRDDEPPRRSRK